MSIDDPLAQSFIVDDPTGVYLTSVDIYFQRVPTDESTPVTVQIREVELGTPSQKILYTLKLISHLMKLQFHRTL